MKHRGGTVHRIEEARRRAWRREALARARAALGPLPATHPRVLEYVEHDEWLHEFSAGVVNFEKLARWLRSGAAALSDPHRHLQGFAERSEREDVHEAERLVAASLESLRRAADILAPRKVRARKGKA